MSTTTPRLALLKAAPTDPVDVVADIDDAFDKLDFAATFESGTSFPGSPFVGKTFKRTDLSNRIFAWDGTIWAEILTGVYTVYSPLWTCSSGTNPSLGNGTLGGRYMRMGPMVKVRVVLKINNTTTFGTGAYIFSLPFVPFIQGGSATALYTGSALIQDASSTTAYPGISYIDATGGDPTKMTAYFAQNSNRFNQGVPITFATGDIIIMDCVYETADP